MFVYLIVGLSGLLGLDEKMQRRARYA